MGLFGDNHLTVLDQEFEDKRQRSFPGMAHFAGTGPLGRTCRECTHWRILDGKRDYFVGSGAPTPRGCEKYRELMPGDAGSAVPHSARACKYFNENPTPPARHQPRR